MSSKLVEKPPTVVILLFNDVQIIDYSGPWEVFGESGFHVVTVAEDSAYVTTVFGQKVLPEYTFANSPDPDILLIPGGNTEAATADPKLIAWVHDNAAKAKHVLSVCTGAFLLAKAGLLDGLTATTFHGAIDDLARDYPKTHVVYDQRYVDNGKVITSAGLSSGIDGALHLVSELLGKGRAQRTALNMEYRWDPNLRYARAALADRYIPNFDSIHGTVLSTQGDTDSWKITALVDHPDNEREILRLTREELLARSPHTLGTVRLIEVGASRNRNAVAWTFTDERGRHWHGMATLEAARDQPGKFLATLSISRDYAAKTARETAQ